MKTLNITFKIKTDECNSKEIIEFLYDVLAENNITVTELNVSEEKEVLDYDS